MQFISEQVDFKLQSFNTRAKQFGLETVIYTAEDIDDEPIGSDYVVIVSFDPDFYEYDYNHVISPLTDILILKSPDATELYNTMDSEKFKDDDHPVEEMAYYLIAQTNEVYDPDYVL